jgi:hypothetical protein
MEIFMATTLADAVRELERLRHARAVWMETVEHLSRFVGNELKNADASIVAEGCIVSSVPEPVVKEFIHYINTDEIEPLNQEIEALESLTVQETKHEDPETPSNDGKPPQAQKEQGPAPIGPGKKLRAVSGAPGPKAQGAR